MPDGDFSNEEYESLHLALRPNSDEPNGKIMTDHILRVSKAFGKGNFCIPSGLNCDTKNQSDLFILPNTGKKLESKV